jgi:hypothetical protein
MKRIIPFTLLGLVAVFVSCSPKQTVPASARVMATASTASLTAVTLANCNVKFHTNDNDKDHDTHVTVEVRDFNGAVCARVDNDFGHFDNNSDNGPFGMPVVNASTKEDCQRGNVRIRIDPNGHDEWHFNFFLTLVFSDGSSLSGGADGLNLDQNRREQTFGLQGILH